MSSLSLRDFYNKRKPRLVAAAVCVSVVVAAYAMSDVSGDIGVNGEPQLAVNPEKNAQQALARIRALEDELTLTKAKLDAAQRENANRSLQESDDSVFGRMEGDLGVVTELDDPDERQSLFHSHSSSRVVDVPDVNDWHSPDERSGIQRALRVLDDAVDDQAFDSAWADAKQENVEALFEASPAGSVLLEVTCRTTLCRIDVAHDDAESEARFVAAYSRHLSALGEGTATFYHRLGEEYGDLRTLFYFAREGYVLPSVTDDR